MVVGGRSALIESEKGVQGQRTRARVVRMCDYVRLKSARIGCAPDDDAGDTASRSVELRFLKCVYLDLTSLRFAFRFENRTGARSRERERDRRRHATHTYARLRTDSLSLSTVLIGPPRFLSSSQSPSIVLFILGDALSLFLSFAPVLFSRILPRPHLVPPRCFSRSTARAQARSPVERFQKHNRQL